MQEEERLRALFVQKNKVEQINHRKIVFKKTESGRFFLYVSHKLLKDQIIELYNSEPIRQNKIQSFQMKSSAKNCIPIVSKTKNVQEEERDTAAHRAIWLHL